MDVDKDKNSSVNANGSGSHAGFYSRATATDDCSGGRGLDIIWQKDSKTDLLLPVSLGLMFKQKILGCG